MPGPGFRLAAAGLSLGLLAACSSGRPLQPAPPLYILWERPGVNEQGVRDAMLACGYSNAAHVDYGRTSPNDYARAQLCMLDQGYTYKERRIICADAPELPACAQVPRGKTFGTDPDFDPALLDRRAARPPAYTLWSRPDADSDGVKRAMLACGYATVVEPVGVMAPNDMAAAQLCMLDQRFTYALPPQGLLCKSSPALPSCRGRRNDVPDCCAAPNAAGQR
ncbi:hypothetical protein KYC_04962 [Achromobacter arsenitoxydans SY8]|uniref:Lipoprotein n=2 Tax=Achromobacter TaxID=222 RepID=H0F2K4_9BURK|nr:hypothetical protein KYC_04962 [Achromobacter arsenitoxydans SY8]